MRTLFVIAILFLFTSASAPVEPKVFNAGSTTLNVGALTGSTIFFRSLGFEQGSINVDLLVDANSTVAGDSLTAYLWGSNKYFNGATPTTANATPLDTVVQVGGDSYVSFDDQTIAHAYYAVTFSRVAPDTTTIKTITAYAKVY